MAEAAAYLAAATKATGVSDLVSVSLAIMMAATAAVASAVASAVATLAAATMATAIDVGGCDDGNGDDKCVCDLMTVILAAAAMATAIDVGGCDDGNGDVGVAFSLSVFPVVFSSGGFFLFGRKKIFPTPSPAMFRRVFAV